MPSVSIPIIDQLVHPSLGLLSSSAPFTLGPGPVSGTLNPPQSGGALTYGVTWSVFTAPAQWGLVLGNPNVYEPWFLELASVYTTLDGRDVVQQVELESIDGLMYFWEEALPSSVLYHVRPGFTLTMRWLQT